MQSCRLFLLVHLKKPMFSLGVPAAFPVHFPQGDCFLLPGTAARHSARRALFLTGLSTPSWGSPKKPPTRGASAFLSGLPTVAVRKVCTLPMLETPYRRELHPLCGEPPSATMHLVRSYTSGGHAPGKAAATATHALSTVLNRAQVQSYLKKEAA